MDIPSLVQVNQLRLSRSHVVRLMQRYFDHVLSEKIIGCYVRVLLEENGDEPGKSLNYRMARIAATRKGVEYSGFSFNNESSTLYLDLDVPQASDTSVTTIQLTSISNSEILDDEYSSYSAHVLPCERAIKLPPPAHLQEKLKALLPSLSSAGVDVTTFKADVFGTKRQLKRGKRTADMAATASSPECDQQQEMIDELEVFLTTSHMNEKYCQKKSPKKRHFSLPFVFHPTPLSLYLSQKRVDSLKPFPKEFSKLSMDELHVLEQDVAQYLTDIRSRVKDMMLCRVCLCYTPLSTLDNLTIKHSQFLPSIPPIFPRFSLPRF